MYISEAFVHSTICREMSVTLSFADNVLCLVHMYCNKAYKWNPKQSRIFAD